MGNHWLAIFLALLLSIIVAAPQVYFRLEHQNDGVYQGIELLPDSPWSTRVREIQDGHSLGNVYNKYGKDNPYLLQPLGSIAVAYMGKVFSLDINNTLLLSRLVLPFLVFLLIYIFILLISRNKLVALSGAAVILLADSIVTFSGATRLLRGLSPDDFLRIARPVNPAMIYVFLFSFLITFWIYYKKRDWRYGLASVVILGLNFYNYFYTWTFLYAFGSVLVVSFLIRKKWRDAASIASVFVGALIVGIPYFINLYRVTAHPSYEEVGARIGVLVSHAPLFTGFTAIAALIIFLLGFPRADKEKYYFGLALLLTPFITHNQQVLTGKVLQEDHYHWFFNKPTAVIFVLMVIWNLLERWRLDKYQKVLAFVVIIVSIFTGVFTQVVSYSSSRRDGGEIAIERQKYGPVMKWLSNNGQKESVVFANSDTSHVVVIYTPLNVYYHRASPFASLSATKERQLDTLFTFYRLRGVGGEETRDLFLAERGLISAEIYGIYYRELLGDYEDIPDEKVEEIAELYRETLAVPTSEWLKQVWEKYEVEYVVWDKQIDAGWKLDQYRFLKKAAEFGGQLIYRFQS